MTELSMFYEALYDGLAVIDYSSFTDADVKIFKNYIFYAFNTLAQIKNDHKILKANRLVENIKVIKSNSCQVSGWKNRQVVNIVFGFDFCCC